MLSGRLVNKRERPMVTLEDVAAHAGVSRATVSRVVNGDSKVKPHTRARVEAAIQALGYAPHPAARALASSQSHTIGLVTTSYRGGFFGAMMDAVQSEAQRHGKQLLVTQGRDSAQNELDAITQLYNLRCDGLLLHVRMLEDDALRALAAAGRRFVVLDREVPGLESRCVAFDHRAASVMATRYLLARGHTSVACLHGPRTRASCRLRLQGFLDAMQAAGLTPVACLEADYSLQGGYAQMQALLAKATPGAVYCCNEEMAVGAMLAMNEHGLRIGQDISCVCYDSGERADFVRPRLTSVHFPISEMARFGARKLLDEECEPQIFMPQMIERDSVKDLAGAGVK
ncbi:LacI family DNA-binding transcriptional regulator [Cronobacter dublinensis]|uniref:LacI family DNA-binding transcriptional regulator n=1 Tax=Cronobacter dublinensis TaxID=413497 RepID=UPI002234DB44|nr:LacI family DNA-binding transcriptional regulator [Cronobacter dublinensis]